MDYLDRLKTKLQVSLAKTMELCCQLVRHSSFSSNVTISVDSVFPYYEKMAGTKDILLKR